MSDKREFDPRFDPAFQRGYVDGGANVPAQPRKPMVAPPQKWADAPQALDSRARPDAVAIEAAAHPEPGVTLEGNPWTKALWVIAGVFVVVGIAGQAYAQMRFSGGGSFTSSDAITSYVLPSVLQAISPWMVLTGLAALVGVVFLHAVRWRAPQ